MSENNYAVATYVENKKSEKKPLIPFKSENRRLITELAVFAFIFVFIELITSLSIGYVMKVQFMFITALTVCALFFIVNIFKNWKVRFSLYSVISIYFMVMAILNCVFAVNKHDSVSVSMLVEAKVGLEFTKSTSSSAYSQIGRAHV